MPAKGKKRKLLMIGSGPVVIGEGAEYDCCAVEACRALMESGCSVVFVGSNPTSVVTDPETADRVYIEPLNRKTLVAIIERERPDALLATMGGQTALSLAAELHAAGDLKKYGVELLGIGGKALDSVRDGDYFWWFMRESRFRELLPGGVVSTLAEAKKVLKRIGFPAALRPAFSVGGAGSSIAYNMEDFEDQFNAAIAASGTGRIIVERGLAGWKEVELELLRDGADQIVCVASLENAEPVGVHSGDSAVFIPAQTLSRIKLAELRADAEIIAREIGVVGSANIRFAVNQQAGTHVLLSAAPCFTRSSLLAWKATGYPVASVAARLACGFRLDEIKVGGGTAFAEPAPGYCVTKASRFPFDKYPVRGGRLDTTMKSEGIAIGAGLTFKESFMKAGRALETKSILGIGRAGGGVPDENQIRSNLIRPNPERYKYIRFAFAAGMSEDEIAGLTGFDRWLVHQIREITDIEREVAKYRLDTIPTELILRAKKCGFGDADLAALLGTEETAVRKQRKKLGIKASPKPMEAAGGAGRRRFTSSGKGGAAKADGGSGKKVIILGGGPNRIGQGIEFDYCCVHAAYAIREAGYIAILINSNPETVSTDFDTSNKLYFEPLTFEDVMNIIDIEKPHGVIVQLGGQTPLNLATSLMRENVPILGTSPDSIDQAEDRKRFKAMLDKLNLTQPDNDTATSLDEATRKARQIGYPLLVRPSYVLGGRAMRIIYEEDELAEYMEKAVEASPDHPILLDRFLDDAIEIDVDAVADGKNCIVCGVMEHIEQAGVHSGDSACCLPPFTLSAAVVEEIKGATRALARELKVIGLMNVQYAIKNNVIYVLEVNPRASRTVPFVSKATGIPWAKVATRVMLGQSLKQQGITKEVTPKHMSVKEAVFPFARFPGVDATLGPEMLSTGEVMGVDVDFGVAYLKSQIAAGQKLPDKGNVFISVNDSDKRAIVPIAQKLVGMGFSIVATGGTSSTLNRNGIDVKHVFKIGEGRPDVIDMIKNGEISLMINTPGGKAAKIDEAKIRSTAVARDIALITTLAGAVATVQGMEAIRSRGMSIKSIQEYHKDVITESGYTKVAKTLQGTFIKVETEMMDFSAMREPAKAAAKKKAPAAKASKPAKPAKPKAKAKPAPKKAKAAKKAKKKK